MATRNAVSIGIAGDAGPSSSVKANNVLVVIAEAPVSEGRSMGDYGFRRVGTGFWRHDAWRIEVVAKPVTFGEGWSARRDGEYLARSDGHVRRFATPEAAAIAALERWTR